MPCVLMPLLMLFLSWDAPCCIFQLAQKSPARRTVEAKLLRDPLRPHTGLPAYFSVLLCSQMKLTSFLGPWNFSYRILTLEVCFFLDQLQYPRWQVLPKASLLWFQHSARTTDFQVRFNIPFFQLWGIILFFCSSLPS